MKAEASSPPQRWLGGVRRLGRLFEAPKSGASYALLALHNPDHRLIRAELKERDCSEQFEGVVDEIAAENIFGLLKDGLKRLLEVRGII
jgi:hypothetical protein